MTTNLEPQEAPLGTISITAAFSTAYCSALRAWLPLISFTTIVMVVQGTALFAFSDRLMGDKGLSPHEPHVALISFPIYWWLWIGLLKVSLNTTRQQPVQLSDLVTHPGLSIRCLVLLTVMLVPVGIGLIFFVVPGLYLLTIWFLLSVLLVDGRAYLFDAFSLSERLTRNNRWKVVLSLCGLGLLTWIGDYLIRKANIRLAMGATERGFETLAVGWIWSIMVLGFTAFVYAALYQQLLERQPMEVTDGATVSSPPPALDSKDG